MKRFLAIITSVISIILIINLSRELLGYSQADLRLSQASDKVTKLKLENWQLQQEKQYRQTDTFLEKEIRDKLLLGKAGETIVVLPKDEVNAIASVSATEENNVSQKPPWAEWLELFM